MCSAVCISVSVSALLCPSVGGSREITSVLVGLVEAGRLGGGQRRPTLTSQPQQPPHSDLSNNTSSYNNTGGEDGGRLGCNLTITCHSAAGYGPHQLHPSSSATILPRYLQLNCQRYFAKVHTIFREAPF